MNVLIIDDERKEEIFPVAVTDSVSIVRNADAGLGAMFDIPWDEVWLDHDLGLSSKDGSYIVNTIEEWCHADPSIVQVKKFIVHTANPVAGERMVGVLGNLGFKVVRIAL